jgi:Leucine-rich repeat (LRR) protein
LPFSISNLQAFKNLKTLSLGRNNLKTLQGIEAAAETLEQLWISYNQVKTLTKSTTLYSKKLNQSITYNLICTSLYQN